MDKRRAAMRGVKQKLPRQLPISSTVFSLVVAAWLAIAYNGTFFRRLIELGGGWGSVDIGFLLAAAIALWAAIHALVSVCTWPYVGKAAAALLVIAAAAASYFANNYGVLIDASVIQSAIETDSGEVSELLNGAMIASAVLFMIVPVALIIAWPIAWQAPAREFLTRAAVFAGSALLFAAAAFAYYPDFAAAARNHRELRLMTTPFNMLRASGKYLAHRSPESRSVQRVGVDARIRADVQAHDKPALLVLVVGETARFDHFSLGGYGRDTNPRLRQQEGIWFSEARACGTSTAVSLPCMFSDVGRSRFDAANARSREGLLHVLARAGYSVMWIDNNSGCKGACSGLPTQELSASANGITSPCPSAECLDEGLVSRLQSYVDGVSGNAVVVLHQKGNHGPAYFRRYPPEFELFAPACRTEDLGRCDRASIVNAYDNAIAYTDYVLAGTIELLRKNQDRFHTALLYISDHGESLGERNVYLHGMPYAIAPDAQTRVPMLIWLSQAFANSHAISVACIRERGSDPVSHDNLFHTTLSLAGVTTEAYRAERDLLSNCDGASRSSHARTDARRGSGRTSRKRFGQAELVS